MKPRTQLQFIVLWIVLATLVLAANPFLSAKDDKPVSTGIRGASHNSGHYTKFVWRKGVGLVEHASNYGAAKDGFHLKRVSAKG